ncbi:hypothetical protein PanWU01x14_291350 [Parasponia andersonii]|uniref:Uncharacterized protein n=1 Tax=Parasponia andersonii TaxID=3476 RepID=A0A2P5AXA0_PARAD|nr:hypothetical protein PanWU01x14_291350 [Parasponia andersonii]
MKNKGAQLKVNSYIVPPSRHRYRFTITSGSTDYPPLDISQCGYLRSRICVKRVGSGGRMVNWHLMVQNFAEGYAVGAGKVCVRGH